MTKTIEELSARELARHAFNVFLFVGRHTTGMRLTYRALELDDREPLAIRCLSDLLDGEGTEILSAIALEYGLAPSTGISGPAWSELDDLRFLSKWTWKFSTHKSGNPHLAGDAFKIRQDFDVDHAKYQAWLEDFLGTDSLESGFRRVHTFAGAVGGLLTPVDSSAPKGAAYTVRPEQFTQGPEYKSWLKESSTELDALEAKRQMNADRPPAKPKSRWKLW